MAYSVEYNPELNRYYPRNKKKMRKRSAKLLLAGVALAVGIYTFGRVEFLQQLLPGDVHITKMAFSDMVQRVSAGEPVGDSVFCFVRDVVVNGYTK